MESDLLIKNAMIFNSYFKKFIPGDLAVSDGKFIHVSKNCKCNIKSEKILDAQGKYIIPGLIDIHLHIESSMTTPVQFAKVVSGCGVTTVVAEPHEITNVFGLKGIEALLNMKCDGLMDIFYSIPSSVPAASFKVETSGGKIGPSEVSELLKNKKIICLGEVMNFKGLVEENDSDIRRIIRLIKNTDPHFVIEGHCPKIYGSDLSKYIYEGVDSDHTQQTPESLQEKISDGMFIEVQEKSMSRENIKYLIENNLYENFCFVTDDVMADKILNGHLDNLVRKSISLGMSPEMAVYVSTYTPARRMMMNDRGSIAPGRIADFCIMDDINAFKINSVYKYGKKIIKDEFKSGNNKDKYFPEYFYRSIKLAPVSESDFNVHAPVKNGDVKCRIIYVKPDTTFTEEKVSRIKVKDGILLWEDSPCCLIEVFERYGKNGNRAYGLVSGSVIKRGAIASTYSHDDHNLEVMGRSYKDMAKAADWVIKNQGGYCVVENGEVIAGVKLPVGGILSEESLFKTGKELKKVREAMKHLGYRSSNEIMSFSTLCLPVSPALKITDKGLIDVKKQEIVNLFLND